MPLAIIQGAPVLFAHVPKCAGSAMEDYLEQAFGPLALLDRGFTATSPAERWTRTSPQHADTASLARLFPPGFLQASFALVRHPIQRIVSVFYHQRDLEGIIPSDMTLEDWLHTLRAPGADPRMYDNHTRPMVQMVPTGARVFRLEDGWLAVIDWLQELAGSSVSLPRVMPEVNVLSKRLAMEGKAYCPVKVTGAAVRIICSLYKEDFLRFGYDLPAQASVPSHSREGRSAPLSARHDRASIKFPPRLLADDADVHIVADGKRMNPQRIGQDAWQFLVPANTDSLHLRSRSTRPARNEDLNDRRVLGLRVRVLEVQDSYGKFQIALDHPMLAQGMHGVERDDARIWRWTDGDAKIPVALLGDTSRPTILTIRGVASTAPSMTEDRTSGELELAGHRN